MNYLRVLAAFFWIINKITGLIFSNCHPYSGSYSHTQHELVFELFEGRVTQLSQQVHLRWSNLGSRPQAEGRDKDVQRNIIIVS